LSLTFGVDLVYCVYAIKNCKKQLINAEWR
jgi:hypothetical protein